MSEEERLRLEKSRADTDRIFTLPNMLSFLRLLLIPLIILLYENGYYWAAFGVLFLSGLTDIVDGWIARTFHLVSDFGKAIDPIADKLTQIAVLLCLMPMKYWWVVGVLVFKEVSIGIMSLMTIHRTHKVYSAGWYGKLCTAVIYLSMGTLMLWEVVIGKAIPTWFITLDAVLISSLIVLAFVNYFIYYTRILRETRGNQTREKK